MINFFDPKYLTEPARLEQLFGICDDGNIAYTTDEGDTNTWVAVVHNTNEKELQFVPVDHNVIVLNKKGEEVSQCDGMLYATDNTWLAFVELKEVRQSWKKKPLDQLESTVQIFLENHDYKLFQRRYAYAVNRKHPQFARSYRDIMQTFHNRYKFRLLYQRDIIVK